MSWVYQYQSTNPCNCASSSNPSDPACTETECNCLDLCNITSSAIEPCGGELILDVTSEAEHDTCACGENDQKWYMAYFDPEVFESATISLDGTTLNAIAITPFSDAISGNIVVKFVCGNLSAFVTITVPIAVMCVEPCAADETCNPCTGICEPNINIGTE